LICGYNNRGQLGLSDDENRTISTQIPELKAKQISAGAEHTVIIDLNDNVWTFGCNKGGELGLGDNIDRNKPRKKLNISLRENTIHY
jgi:alpha-tubulin suppressor-like RCC1 family protein